MRLSSAFLIPSPGNARSTPSRNSRATMQRIREVTYRGRAYRRANPVSSERGRRVFAAVHWVRAHLGLADAEDLPARLANAGYKGHFPVDVYQTARVVGPALGLGRAEE